MNELDQIRNLLYAMRSENDFKTRADIADRIFDLLNKVEQETP